MRVVDLGYSRSRRRDDNGTVLLLTLGYAVIALVLVLAVTDVSVALLARRDLQTVADGASLEAAEKLAAAGTYRDGSLTVDEAAAQQVVSTYLSDADLADVRWTAQTRGDTVDVTLQRAVALPFAQAFSSIGLAGLDRVTLTVHAHGRLTCAGC